MSVKKWGPSALGIGALLATAAVLELLIRGGTINPYIVPLPSQVLLAFERVVVEENVVHRFLLTTAETLVAGALITVVGMGLGVLLHRFRLIRAACETWVAAFASAPIVLMYPLFLVVF
ncbi:MAG TPA: ABC transporter permease, partial [Casimicrobiaceae bacterium]